MTFQRLHGHAIKYLFYNRMNELTTDPRQSGTHVKLSWKADFSVNLTNCNLIARQNEGGGYLPLLL